MRQLKPELSETQTKWLNRIEPFVGGKELTVEALSKIAEESYSQKYRAGQCEKFMALSKDAMLEQIRNCEDYLRTCTEEKRMSMLGDTIYRQVDSSGYLYADITRTIKTINKDQAPDPDIMRALISIQVYRVIEKTIAQKREELEAKKQRDRESMEQGNARKSDALLREQQHREQLELARQQSRYTAEQNVLQQAALQNLPAETAVCIPFNGAAMNLNYIGISGRASRQFRRNDRGDVVYTGGNTTPPIQALADLFSGKESMEVNRDTWHCAEAHAALQIALAGGNPEGYKYLTVIRHRENNTFTYIQLCNNCRMRFSEPFSKG
jgi:hypothetical protein